MRRSLMNRKLRKFVEYNSVTLEKSDRTFEAIYGVMFGDGQKDNVMAEESTGYRVKQYTYSDIKAMIESASSALYEKIGSTHAFVALEMENRVEWIVAFWAILKSGNKPYLVNCRHPKQLSCGIVESLGIKYVVGVGKTELPLEFIDVTELKSDKPFNADFENEIALSTSATTMKETVCFYTGREISSQILNARTILKQSKLIPAHVNGSLKQLAFLPFYHIFGLIAVYFWFTYYGRCIVFLRDYSSDSILRTCRNHGVTHVFAVPMLWHTMEKEVRKAVRSRGEAAEKKFEKGLAICEKIQNVFPMLGIRISHIILREITGSLFGNSIRCCISGGSYINDSALKLFNALGYPLHNGYGMSEIGITSVELGSRPKDRNMNSVGLPFDSVEYRISEKGTLLVKGDSICSKMTVNGETVPRGEWFDTGDVAKYVDGRYYIIGRLGDAVIGENGENINPDVIEQSLDISDAEAFCVLGLEHDGSEELSLVVKINRYLPSDRIASMISRIYSSNDALPMATRVKRFYMTYDDLCAKTAVKVGRAYLKKIIGEGKVALIPFSEIKASDNVGFDAESTVAKAVIKIIADNLDIEKDSIGADSHIVHDLGATSLQYFNIVSDIAKEFSLTGYSENDSFCYTLRDICDYIERHI